VALEAGVPGSEPRSVHLPQFAQAQWGRLGTALSPRRTTAPVC
jgi:hypothetical protein